MCSAGLVYARSVITFRNMGTPTVQAQMYKRKILAFEKPMLTNQTYIKINYMA